ncbi:hypothetical protein ACWD0J_01235 [Streptomyces sp. NPDC003011]
MISTHWSAISSVFYAALLTFSLSKPLAATVAGQRSQPTHATHPILLA